MITLPTEPAILMVKAFGDAARQLGEIGPFDDAAGGRSTLARAIMTVEGIIANGLASFESISQIDTAWHTAVYSELIEYDPRIPEIIMEGFRDWHEMTGKVLSTVDLLEQRSGPITGADALRANFREAAGIITPDDQFFEGEKLGRLAADAITADDRGETVEFTEMGD